MEDRLTEERACVACGSEFVIPPRWSARIAAGEWATPVRCPRCHAERNRARIRARVRQVGPLYAFVVGDDGRDYFLLLAKLRPSRVVPGDLVEFYPSGPPEAPGLCPKAWAPRIVRSAPEARE